MREKFREKKGITLVALVITIIIIIILASIAITGLMGENGLISKAKDATNSYKENEGKESEYINSIIPMIDNAGSNTETQNNDNNNESEANEEESGISNEATLAVKGKKYVTIAQDFAVDLFCSGTTYQKEVTYEGRSAVFDFTSDGGQNTYREINTNKIDLTNVKKIKVDYEVSAEPYGASIGLYNDKYLRDFLHSNDTSGNFVVEQHLSLGNGIHITTLDVENYTGEYVIALLSWRGSGDKKGKFKVNKITLILNEQEEVPVGVEYQVPAMTGNETVIDGYGTMVASASSVYQNGSDPYKAFDQKVNKGTMELWHAQSGTFQWIQLQLPVQTKITRFSIKNRDWSGRDTVERFVLFGSNDGIEWTSVTGELTNSTVSNATTEFEVTEPNYYSYYKWRVSKTYTSYAVIDEIYINEAFHK